MSGKIGLAPLLLVLLLQIFLLSCEVTGNDVIVLPTFCCPENVTLSKQQCDDGSSPNLRNCSKYIMEPLYDEFEFFKNGSMLYDNDTESILIFDKVDYCMTQRDGFPVAVVCIADYLMDDNHSGYLMRALCEIISVIFIISTILVYALVPILRDLQGKCILNFLVGLAISFLVLAIIQNLPFERVGYCELFAFLTYYGFMITFFWLNVISFHIWRTTVYPTMFGTDKQWYRLYVIYAYSSPTCFLIASLAAHHTPGEHVKPGFGQGKCWFSGNLSTWLYFYGPISILLGINIVLFIWSSISLCKASEQLREKNLRSKRYRLMLCIKLFFIMGVLWVFEVLSFAFEKEEQAVFWIITDYVNALQGVLIFLLLVVFRKRAIRGLAKRGLLCFQFPQTWKTLVDEEGEETCDNAEEVEHHLRAGDTQIENR